MHKPFKYFVILAGMRTGSNLLESRLNAFAGIHCHGELFNPAFINTPGTACYLSVSLEQRTSAPLSLIERIQDRTEVLSGFRLFHEHNRVVWDYVIQDEACAKIVLNRSTLDSWVSLEIAKATDQWRIGNVSRRRTAKVDFDALAFQQYEQSSSEIQRKIQHSLQSSAQSAFYIGYDDLNDVEVLNGLAGWLGLSERIESMHQEIIKQNPEPLSEKVTNFDTLKFRLPANDPAGIMRTPNFEARRGAIFPEIRTGFSTPLIFLSLEGGPTKSVRKWLSEIDGVDINSLGKSFDHGRLDTWRRARSSFMSFTVVREPLKRAFSSFLNFSMNGALRRRGVGKATESDLGSGIYARDMQEESLRVPFKSFLRQVENVLQGSAPERPHNAILDQTSLLEQYAKAIIPDRIFREENLVIELNEIAESAGCNGPKAYTPIEESLPEIKLVIDDEIIDLTQKIYRRDYLRFGFATDSWC